jgi:hypothetical protein
MAAACDTYWRHVRARASADTKAALSIGPKERIAIGVVLTITAIALLWMLGSEGASWDEAIGKVGPWIVLILTVYPIVWTWKFLKAPAKMDSELRERIAALEARLEPRLAFTWRPNDNKYLERVDSPEGMMEPIKIGSVAVKNLSERESVRDVEVRLIHYRTDDFFKSLDRHLLNNSDGQQKVNLHARSEANFNLFRVAENGTSISLGPFVGGDATRLPPGRWTLKVTASAENMKRENALFLLEFDSHGNIKYGLLGNTSDVDSAEFG